MKKLTTSFLVILLALNFTSCSDNEVLTEQPQENLLKSFKLERDANGSYSLNYEVANNTDAISVKNEESKTNEIYLTNSEDIKQKRHSENFLLDNNKLKIGLVDANTNKRANISVEDENITFAKDGDVEFLNSYSVKGNDDGTYQLDFKVNDNVKTEFVYNESSETYEIHLSTGEGEENFSRDLELSSDELLKIDFVNHKNTGKTSKENADRKPRIIMEMSSGD